MQHITAWVSSRGCFAPLGNESQFHKLVHSCLLGGAGMHQGTESGKILPISFPFTSQQTHK